jgi:hypothetical protein
MNEHDSRAVRYEQAQSAWPCQTVEEEHHCGRKVRFHGRRVSTTLRQVLTKLSKFFICWVFHK